MRHILLSVVVFLFSACLKAQLPAGGVDLVTDLISNHYLWDNESVASDSILAVSGQSFSQALEIAVNNQPSVIWNLQLQLTETGGCSVGDVLLFTFFARVSHSIQETGEGFLTAVIEHSSTYSKTLYHATSLTNEWVQYYLPVVALEDLSQGNLAVAFHLGYPVQRVQIAAVRLINYQNQYDVADMPKTALSYIGRDPEADWRADAETRIEQYRKGDMAISVKDINGHLITGAEVNVRMLDHHFGFGSAVGACEMLENAPYRDTALALFNEFTMENALKWASWQWPSTKSCAHATISDLLRRGKRVRGHVLVWPSFKWNPDYLQEYAGSPVQLRTEINNHIDDVTNHFAGQLVDWDVMNEPYTNREFMDILGYDEMAEWYKRARLNDTVAKLYINDYSILSAGGLDVARQDDYYQTILDIDADGGNIQGVGLQSHFATQLTPITKIYAILERFAELGKAIKITEFDINLTDEALQADYQSDFMKIVFSHPSVESFIMWGFWQGNHWRPDAAMYNTDWTPKQNLSAYKNLVFQEWWTPPLEVASTGNVIVHRGFLGQYEITSSFQGETIVDTVWLEDFTQPNSIEIRHVSATTGMSRQFVRHSTCIYPNPVGDRVMISEPGNWVLFDLFGKPLDAGYGQSILLRWYPRGIYLLKTKGGVFKVVKE